MSIFRLTMFPADEGDCLLLSYGEDEKALEHILIDGGTARTWDRVKDALGAIKVKGEQLRLMVLSHIDSDHLDGLMSMIRDDSAPRPQSLWYNGYNQLAQLEEPAALGPLGFEGADQYSALLAQAGWTLNREFGGSPIHIADGPKVIDIGLLRLTLLSPSRGKLQRLMRQWKKWRSGREDTPINALWGPLGTERKDAPSIDPAIDVEALSKGETTDSSAPNGSSIAFIAEFQGKRALLAADAHVDLLEDGFIALADEDSGKYAIDLFKLSHHASRANISKRLLKVMSCNRFAISTSGARFGHPDREAVAKILAFGPKDHKSLMFNYKSQFTEMWQDDELQNRWNYDCVFPDAKDDPLIINI